MTSQGHRRVGRAAMMVMACAVLADVAAGCSAPPAAARALATWLVTIGLGATMMARWITRARPGRGAARNFAHLGLAVTGLGTWIGYLASGVVGLAWAGCGLLLATISLGMTLVFLAPAHDPGTSQDRPPPALLVGVHIAFACATILLATLAAAGSV